MSNFFSILHLYQTPSIDWAFIVFIADIILVFLIVYKLLLWIIHSYAENLVKGLFFIFSLYFFSLFFGFSTLSWLLGKFSTVLIILIIIIFQPELRRFLERLGSGSGFFSPLLEAKGQGTSIIKQLLKSITFLSKEKLGALIVIEGSVNLSEFIDSGVLIQGEISHDLLTTLFWINSPTHDGAVIIRNNKIEAAGCLLPLTGTVIADRRLGTRHRAALALSEITDALVFVVSEETGTISLAEKGNLTRYLNKEALETRLFNLYKEDSTKKKFGVKKIINVLKRKKL
jgi:diadenylate cyclase